MEKDKTNPVSSCSLFADSFRELKNVHSLVGFSMLMAVHLVLSLTASIQLSENLRISFGFLASALMGMLYGPSLTALGLGIVDILQLFIKPTGPYFPGFTLTAILTGIIYGCFLYKNKCTLGRIIASKVLVNLLLQLLLNSLWLKILYGSAFFAMLPTRLLKNVALLPIEIPLLYLLLPNVSKIWKKRNPS